MVEETPGAVACGEAREFNALIFEPTMGKSRCLTVTKCSVVLLSPGAFVKQRPNSFQFVARIVVFLFGFSFLVAVHHHYPTSVQQLPPRGQSSPVTLTRLSAGHNRINALMDSQLKIGAWHAISSLTQRNIQVEYIDGSH